MARRHSQELVPVYESLTMIDANRLADRLSDAGIEAYIENADSPSEGLIGSRESKIVLVPRRAAADARELVQRLQDEGWLDEPLDEEDREVREATGMTLSSEQRPSHESPSADIEGEGVERLSAERPGPEAPEVEGLILDKPEGRGRDADGDDRIRGFGPDRDVAQPPESEIDEIEDQPIDDLDMRALHDDEKPPAQSGSKKKGKKE